MYKITAIVYKIGNPPVNWTHYSKKRLTQEQCVKRLSDLNENGRPAKYNIRITDFHCKHITEDLSRILPENF
jgi:antisense regulator of RalR protein